MAKATLLSWSSGKDSAWALHTLRDDPRYRVTGLFTTVNAQFDRVAMHATRRQLLEAQADAAGLPLHVIDLPWPCSNDAYEKLMTDFLEQARALDVEVMAFGDLYLEDIRKYRETMLKGTGFKPIFPIWGLPTPALARDMIAGGLKARISCVDPAQLSADFAGRDFDESFLADLPDGVDPCGENGEFHSFTYAGPMFSADIAIESGEIVERDNFVFADILPAGKAA